MQPAILLAYAFHAWRIDIAQMRRRVHDLSEVQGQEDDYPCGREKGHEPQLADALARRPIKGRRARRHGRGAAARGLAAVGHGARTHHAAYRYEDNVLAIMQENLARLWRGETELLNQVV